VWHVDSAGSLCRLRSGGRRSGTSSSSTASLSSRKQVPSALRARRRLRGCRRGLVQGRAPPRRAVLRGSVQDSTSLADWPTGCEPATSAISMSSASSRTTASRETAATSAVGPAGPARPRGPLPKVAASRLLVRCQRHRPPLDPDRPPAPRPRPRSLDPGTAVIERRRRHPRTRGQRRGTGRVGCGSLSDCSGPGRDSRRGKDGTAARIGDSGVSCREGCGGFHCGLEPDGGQSVQP
jgi:hypothetical protein